MALPALRALKDNFPGAAIYLVTKEYLHDIFENIAEISEIITIPNTFNMATFFKAAQKIKKYHSPHSPSDPGILFTNSFNSALLFKLAGIKRTIGYLKDLRGFLLHKKIQFPRNDDRHHVYFYLALVEALLEEETGKTQTIDRHYSHGLVITAAEQDKTASLLSSFGIDLENKTVIGISPSAAYGAAKAWFPGRFGALIRRILREKPVPDPVLLLFGSAKEREKISRIIAASAGDGSRNSNVFNLAGQLTLRQAIAAISFCRLFISNDSGLMHIASSLDIPLAALFGPTVPHKTGPLNEKTKILHYPETCPCAPCLYRECPLDHSCMSAITVDEVFDTLVSLWHSSSSSSTSTFSKNENE